VIRDDKRWHELEDGDPFHALHVRQLADAALDASAQLAIGIGAAGRFVVPSGAQSVFNRIELDEQTAVVELEDVALVTASGQLARVPLPCKSKPIADGEHGFLNLYARPFANGSGGSDLCWEHELPKDPRGIGLAEWRRPTNTLEILPLPFSIRAQHAVEKSHGQLAQACAALSASVHSAAPDALARLSVSAAQRSLLEPLLEALEGVGAMGADVPIPVARIQWCSVARLAASWLCYAVAREDGRDASADAWSRRELMRCTSGSDRQDDLAQLCRLEPATGSALLRWLDRVTSAVERVRALLEGASEELRLVPFESDVPEGWPLGVRYGFVLPPRSDEAAVRCEIEAAQRPSVYSAQFSSSQSPRLTLRQLRVAESLESGLRRFELALAAPPGPDTLVLVVDPRPTTLRVYLRAAHRTTRSGSVTAQ
jgi:hypothetical protein